MTTTTERTEAEVVRDIERLAAELRRTNPKLSAAQAFTHVLDTDAGLRTALGRARQHDRVAAVVSPDEELAASLKRIGEATLTLLAHLERQDHPELSDAVARGRVLARTPLVHRLMNGLMPDGR